MHDYRQVAAVVGEDKVAALRKIGVDIGDKPAKPTTGLLGRWVKSLDGKDMVICNDKPDKSGLLVTAWVDPRNVRGTGSFVKNIAELTFPEETTRAQDIPTGEAWLVNLNAGNQYAERVKALKIKNDGWVTAVRTKPDSPAWSDDEVTLIAPLIPAGIVDNDRGCG